jgi:hypothetical protein
MKKYISVLLAVLIFLCFAGCNTQKSAAFPETDAASAKYDKIAASAEKTVKKYWKQLYGTEAAANSDGYFESSFVHAGINQTLHQVHMYVLVDVAVLVLGRTVIFTVESDVVVAETIIVGDVPDTFFQGGNYGSQKEN